MKIVEATGGTLHIGRRGENFATRVIFPVARWIELYGEGTFHLIAQRPRDNQPYPVKIFTDECKVFWDVKSADTSVAGVGRCELQYYVGDVLAKSMIYVTDIAESLDTPGEPPAPYQSWVDDVLIAADDAQEAADRAEEATVHQPMIGENGTWWTWDQETEAYSDTRIAAQGPKGEKGDKGERGDTGTIDVENPIVGEYARIVALGEDGQPVRWESVDLEKMIYNTYPTKSVSGPIASFSDGADGIPVKALTVNIEPIQEGVGDPSPDNVRPIKGWTGVTIKRHGATEEDNPTTLTVDFGDAGTVYGGTLDVTTGLLTVTHSVVQYDGSRDEVWQYLGASGGRFFAGSLANFRAPDNNIKADIKCDKLLTTPNSGIFRSTPTISASTKDLNYFIVRVHPELATVSEFISWLEENPLTVVYSLTTPITYQLTPQQVTTLLGQNNIFADTSDVSVTYRRDPTLALEELETAIANT